MSVKTHDQKTRACGFVFVTATCFALTATVLPALGATDTLSSVINPKAVCSTAQSMVIGLGSPRESISNMRVDKVRIDGRDLFQSVHRSIDPRDATFDLTLVDAKTLQPISSTSSYVSPELHFVYAEKEALLMKDGAIAERVALDESAMPEGPGADIIMQAINWREGLSFRAVMVDRWRGNGQERAKPGIWQVNRRMQLTPITGNHDVYVAMWTPDDASFGITYYLTTSTPHYAVRVEYRADPEQRPLISETAAFAAYCGPKQFGV